MSRVEGTPPDFGKYLEAAKDKKIDSMTSKELKQFSKDLLDTITTIGNRNILQNNDKYKANVATLVDRVIVKTKNSGKNPLQRLWQWIIGGDRIAARNAAMKIARTLEFQGLAGQFADNLQSGFETPAPPIPSIREPASINHQETQQQKETALIQKAQTIKAAYDEMPNKNIQDIERSITQLLAQTDNEVTKKKIREIFNGPRR
jgi:hypothetical protein